MKSLIIIVKSNFKRRILITLLAGLSISFSTLLFSASLAVLQSIQKPFDKLFDRLNASHIVMLFNIDENPPEKIRAWFASQPETERVTEPTPYYYCNGPVLFKNSKIDIQVQLTELGKDNQVQDKLLLLSGEDKSGPERSEIWLPKYLAMNNDIKLGDTLRIPIASGTKELIVSGLVADPHYGSGMINPTRAWLSPGELLFFLNISELKNTMLGVRLKQPENTQVLWERFNKQFHYTGTSLTYALFKNAYQSIYQIMGNVVLIFSLMAIIISMILVRNVVRISIFQDYKFIGVYKALGFTPGNILSTYLLHYLALSMLFIPVGLVGSFTAIKILTASIVEKLGSTGIDVPIGSLFLLTTVTILILILVTVLTTSMFAAKIKPSIAIRTGAPQPGKKKNISLKKVWNLNLPVEMLLGLHYLSISPKRIITQVLVVAVATFIISFSIDISFSFENLKHNKAAWGFENSDVQVTRKEAVIIPLTHAQMMELLKHERDIKNIVPFGYVSLSILSESDLPIEEIYGKAYGSDPAEVGLISLNGHHPKGEKDIALCINTARQLGKNVGDSINVWIEGQRLRFFIAGIYQDASNLGKGFRMHTKALQKLNPVFSPSQYCLTLYSHVDPAKFKQALLTKFGEAVSINQNIEDRIAQMGIIAGVKSALLSLSLFFVLILLLTIGNDMMSNILEHQKSFGILKSIGYTPFQIRSSLTWKSIFLTMNSLLIGISTALWITPHLMSSLSGGIGLVRFPYLINFYAILLQVPVTITLVALCSWWLSGRTETVSPRTLINA
jgi:putative ABC transport system permease protein